MTETSHAATREPSPFASSFFLSGATASGKSALGVEIARRINAEIVSLDSMAIYRRMDVGTAKPTLEERGGVPHYMIDVVGPESQFSVVEYMRQAADVVRDIESRGKTALFVGGTPLYLKTILFGVFDAPAADEALRESLRAIEREQGSAALWNELEKVDPKSAARLHPNDVKRLVRALEVYRLTGTPLSEQQTQFDADPLVEPDRIFILSWPREILYDRINRRVDVMMEQGFLEETRRLFETEPLPGPTASKAVGYRELKEALDGKTELADAVEKIKQLTRNFAKRQETWFRSLTAQGARRIEVEGRSSEELRDDICAQIQEIAARKR